MKLNKEKIILIIINCVFGSTVILSYISGFVQNPENLSKLWGNVPNALLPFYTSWMIVAASGYFAFLYFIIIKIKPDEVKIANRYNYSLFYWIFLLILIPSAIWMPLTFKMIISPSLFTWILIRIVLSSVAVGSIALIIAIIKTKPIESKLSHKLAILGSIAFSIQTVLLDALIWTYYFPI